MNRRRDVERRRRPCQQPISNPTGSILASEDRPGRYDLSHLLCKDGLMASFGFPVTVEHGMSL